MFRNRRSPAILGMVIMLVLAAISSVLLQSADARPLGQATPTPTPSGATYYTFSVKFVCGFQPTFVQGEPPVKPGNYATEINIHNYTYSRADVRKKVLLLVEQGQPIGREPQQVKPRAFDGITLEADNATMDDCNRIWALLYPGVAPPTPLPLLIGYLTLTSKFDLDVDAVYTAQVYEQPSVTTPPRGISLDVERVPGKRVFIPTGALSSGPLH